MDRNLALEFVRVTEAAALAASRWAGRGERNDADQAATEAMRKTLASVEIDGTIVIGEGERDEAPMLYIGEKVGNGNGPKVQIAVDPVEGTNLVALGNNSAIAVIAAAVEGDGFLMHAPDTYMRKLVVGQRAVGSLDITLPVKANLKMLAKCLDKELEDLTVGILDRPRHEQIIADIRATGARIRLIGDGDVNLAVAALEEESGIDALMGTGGAPEGVLAAAAVQCMKGEMQAQFEFRDKDDRKRAARMLETDDLDRILYTEDLASGNVIFAATGITSGDILKGVRFTGHGAITQSLVMRSYSGTIRHIEARHFFAHEPVY
jgi:fructose-1,6-bisphosphatase class II